MIINLWYNKDMNQWRWTLTDPSTFDMESGQSLNLRDAMNDVSTTVECLISKLKPPSPEVLLYDK
jgi:hypothetical protein